MIYYFINYETVITAIGECNPPYMIERGYTEVSKEVYDDYIANNPEYLAKQKALTEDETTDFETAIITDLDENEIEVGKDKFINGELVKGE